MSVHAMIAAAYLEDLPQATKLVLMAAADSSDEHTLEAAPGLPKLRAWSGLGRRRVLAIVAELEGAGYLEQIVKAHRGRRAVWRVFPAGVPSIPHPSEVAARYADEAVVPIVDTDPSVVDNPTEKGAAHDTQSDGMGAISDGMGATATAPLQSSTSVSMGSSSHKSTGPRVDKPTPSASTASGFPGARKAREDGTPAPRTRNEGPPCPYHPEQRVPCGRCAHAAAQADRDTGVKAVRDALRKSKTATTTATEEASAS